MDGTKGWLNYTQQIAKTVGKDYTEVDVMKSVYAVKTWQRTVQSWSSRMELGKAFLQ